MANGTAMSLLEAHSEYHPECVIVQPKTKRVLSEAERAIFSREGNCSLTEFFSWCTDNDDEVKGRAETRRSCFLL